MKKCQPGCTCGHHTRTEFKSCGPGCTCGRHQQTEEHRRKNSEANLGRAVGETTRQRISVANTGNVSGGRSRRPRSPAEGSFVDEKGYVRLTMEDDHPLASRVGHVKRARKVLYDDIGPGPHECHWGCGKLLQWGGHGGIYVDHLDGDTSNDDLDNLVPSCNSCNARRAKAGNPTEWSA